MVGGCVFFTDLNAAFVFCVQTPLLMLTDPETKTERQAVRIVEC